MFLLNATFLLIHQFSINLNTSNVSIKQRKQQAVLPIGGDLNTSNVSIKQMMIVFIKIILNI